MLRELDHRGTDGIEVWFLWDDSAKNDPKKPEFHIKVSDVREGSLFTLSVDTFQDAREAYRHPFGVANRYLKSGKVTA